MVLRVILQEELLFVLEMRESLVELVPQIDCLQVAKVDRLLDHGWTASVIRDYISRLRERTLAALHLHMADIKCTNTSPFIYLPQVGKKTVIFLSVPHLLRLWVILSIESRCLLLLLDCETTTAFLGH